MHQIVVMLLTLGVLVTIHEFGHYWVARKCGVRVLRFSIGFGPIIYRWKNRLETEFAISALPLGGYVKMLDERESPVADADKPYAFNNKSVRQRIAIVSAGPLANFILAVFVYWLVFLRGTVGLVPVLFAIEEDSVAAQAGLVTGLEIITVDGVATPTVSAVAMQLMERIGDDGIIILEARKPGTDVANTYRLPIRQWLGDEEGHLDFFSSLGMAFYQPIIEPVVDEVLPDSAAEWAGIKTGDKLLSADGKPINDWMQWVDYVRLKPDVEIHIQLLRGGQVVSLAVTPLPIQNGKDTIGQVGISVKLPETPAELLVKEDYNVITAWLPAFERTWQAAVFSLQSLKKMILGDISYKQLSGPISIAKVASESANSGIYSYLSLLALLSVSLGVLNLLPVPVLDGGHILFYGIEWIKGTPVSEKIQQAAYQFGMLMVLSLMVLALFNDLGRL